MLGVDWRQAQVYVASNMDPHELKREGVSKLVPARLKKKGPRPGSTTLELRTKKKDPDAPPSVQASSKWAATDPESELSDVDKRLPSVRGSEDRHVTDIQATTVTNSTGLCIVNQEVDQ